MERTETTNKIEWYRDFYKWRRVDDFKFTLEELVELNNGLTITKYDPEIISKHAFISSALSGVFPDFDLYQFDESALYRTYPIRVIHSKKYGKTFELDGTNAPLYEFMEFIKPKIADISTWLKDEAVKYVMLFFDNVRGKHGRFSLIDLTLDPILQIKNRVNNFHRLKLGWRSKKESTSVMVLQHTEFKNEFKLSDNWQKDIFPFVEGALVQLFKNRELPITEVDNERAIIKVYMVFATALFISEVVVSGKENKDKSFGNIDLQNEKLLSFRILRNNNGEYNSKFIAEEISQSSKSNHAESKSNGDTEIMKIDRLPFLP